MYNGIQWDISNNIEVYPVGYKMAQGYSKMGSVAQGYVFQNGICGRMPSTHFFSSFGVCPKNGTSWV